MWIDYMVILGEISVVMLIAGKNIKDKGCYLPDGWS